MAGWHHWLDGREFEWTLGVGDGQGGLACCSPWGCKESDTTEWLNWTEPEWRERSFLFFFLMPVLCGIWDLNSPIRDRTHAPCAGNTVLTTGLPGKSPYFKYWWKHTLFRASEASGKLLFTYHHTCCELMTFNPKWSSHVKASLQRAPRPLSSLCESYYVNMVIIYSNLEIFSYASFSQMPWVRGSALEPAA